jgi:hypothetical protein
MAEIFLVYGGKWPIFLSVQQSISELISHPNLVLVTNISKIMSSILCAAISMLCCDVYLVDMCG